MSYFYQFSVRIDVRFPLAFFLKLNKVISEQRLFTLLNRNPKLHFMFGELTSPNAHFMLSFYSS